MARTFSFGVAAGQIFQLGYIVPDAEAAMRACAETLRIGPFTSNSGFKAPDGWYRGSTEMPKLTIAHAYNGSLFIEYIQQHDDTPSVYKEHIDRFGYGLHHYGLAIAPEDYDRTIESYYNMGFENVFTDTLPGGVRIRYIGPKTEQGIEKLRNEIGVGYLECVEVKENEEAMFSGMRDAALNWDGKTLLRQRG
ncbi:MAG: VOC family protein [Oscillospiraceae bacterium]|nr:VOC family protein [Oscillospiraceae bacterium]